MEIRKSARALQIERDVADWLSGLAPSFETFDLGRDINQTYTATMRFGSTRVFVDVFAHGDDGDSVIV